MEPYLAYIQPLIENVVLFAPKLASAVAVLLIGFWIVKRINRLLQSTLQRISFDEAISSFLVSLTDIVLRLVVILVAAGIIGFELAGLVGIMAGAAFAIGLALQGSLSNFAAGILIVVFKPYLVGEWIEVQDKFGRVEEIQIFNTIIVTPGMKTLILPNGQVIDGIVTNYSKKGHIRLELTVTMSYEESFPRVKKIIEEVLTDIPNVLHEPVPEVGIECYDSHNLVIAVRPYVSPDHFWDVTFNVHQRVKQAFNEHGIRVAYSEGVEMGIIGE